MELEVGQSNDIQVPESEIAGVEDFGLVPNQGEEETVEEQNIDLNFEEKDNEDETNDFNIESELESLGFHLNEGGEALMNEFFEENGINTPEAKRAVLLTYKSMQSTNETDDESDLDDKVDEILEKEYSKLTSEESDDVDKVIEYIELTATPDQIPAIEKMMETAEGYRFMRQNMYAAARGNMPNTHKQESFNAEPFTMDEYQEYTQKINEEAAKMNFAKVETLKNKMKKEIQSRGSKELKRDLSFFLNN